MFSLLDTSLLFGIMDKNTLIWMVSYHDLIRCASCKARKDRGRGFSGWGEPCEFGDLLTADHFECDFRGSDGILRSRAGHRFAVVIQDYLTKTIRCFPVVTKSARDTGGSHEVKRFRHCA